MNISEWMEVTDFDEKKLLAAYCKITVHHLYALKNGTRLPKRNTVLKLIEGSRQITPNNKLTLKAIYPDLYNIFLEEEQVNIN